MTLKHLRWLVILIPLLMSVASAQESFGLTSDEVTILDRINNSRLRENLVHLMPSEALNRVADAWVEDLTARPIETLGDVYLTRSRQSIEDLLTREGFAAYPDGYTVDFIPIIVRDFGPAQIIDFWINDFRQPEPQLRSRRNIRFNDPQLPMFSALYREIGIAWRFSEITQRHYYVIVFGAEPNVLPVITTQRSAIDQIAQTVAQREVVLYIHDERVNRFGQGGIIGAIEKIRVSEQPGDLDCDDPTPDWQPYTNELLWSLSPGTGLKTLYVQMCDNAARTVLSTAQVSLSDQSAAPDVMGVVRATQTAAAQATTYAPYQPTIQAILTATARASETPTP